MTIPSERSRAFLAGLDLLHDLLDRKKTPRVPAEVRERARRVLRHYPSASELLLAVDSGREGGLGAPLFDTAEIDRYLAAKYPALRAPAPLPADESP